MVNGEGVVTREGRAIQKQSIWCAGLSCLSGSSNRTNETDRRNQIDQTDQIPALRHVGLKDRNSFVALQLVKGESHDSNPAKHGSCIKCE